MSSAGNGDEQGPTEEKISKNELKRQQKAQQKAEEKAKKAAAAPPQQQGAAKKADAGKENEEQELDPNEYYKMRIQHIQTLKRAGETVFP